MIVSQQSRYISIPEAAKELGVAPQTIRYYCRRLGIPIRRIPLRRESFLSREDYHRILRVRAGEELQEEEEKEMEGESQDEEEC